VPVDTSLDTVVQLKALAKEAQREADRLPAAWKLIGHAQLGLLLRMIKLIGELE
jgi:hypothetical protein